MNMKLECISVTGVCGQYMTVSLTQNLHFIPMKLSSIYAWNSRYQNSINPRQTFEVPFHNQKIGVWRVITAAWIVGPIFFKQTMNSESYVNGILHSAK
jgi:nicotinamide riboside transporter PnuC